MTEGACDRLVYGKVGFLSNSPLMAILADHLDVPSRTLCLMLFMC